MFGNVVTLMLFAASVCLLQEAHGSSMPGHPQQKYCNADYVFMFRAMAMVAPSTAGRTKRGLVAGGYMRVMRPKKQMVEVERIYKGEEMMMPMMKLTRTSETPVDTFSAATKIEAAIQIGLYEKEFKKNEKCIYFGRMLRYRNNTMKPSNDQSMMAYRTNTVRESTLTKVMRRGLRKKYATGCSQGCRVKTVFSNKFPKNKDVCYWNFRQFPPPQTDCRVTTQFCYRDTDGYCKWKVTKAYRKCMARKRLP